MLKHNYITNDNKKKKRYHNQTSYNLQQKNVYITNYSLTIT